MPEGTTGCPGCGDTESRTLFTGTDRLYRTTSQSFLIVECAGCGLIRLKPRPSPEELGQYYPNTYWYSPDSSVSSRLEQAYRSFTLRDHVNFVRTAVRDAGAPGLLLDVGCGGGLFLRLMHEEGLSVLGLDSSRQAASLALKANRVVVVCGDLSNSPVANSSCSVITMFHVLEHLLDPVGYLQSARALLRPEGRLVVQVPNASSWQFRLFRERWNGVDVPRHLINYRQKDLENLLDFCGFQILRRKQFSLRDNPAGFATSVAPQLDPMARRVRRIVESPILKILKDALYLGLVAVGLPFALLEAACGAGSTIMLEARRK